LIGTFGIWKGFFVMNISNSPKTIIDMELRKNIKKILNERGMTLTALSEKSGIPLQTLKNWSSSGGKPGNVDQLRSVCKVLGVTIEELVYGEVHHTIDSLKEDLMIGRFEVILRPINKK
jgi:DNA-binding Xre family transcriptional regulator